MIAALVLTLQVVAAAPTVLVVRDDARELSVPLVSASDVMALQPERLEPLVRTTVRRLPESRFELVIGGVTMELAEHVPFVRIRSDVVPLVGAPIVDQGALIVPLQLITDVLPRFASTLTYDPRHRELRVARAVTERPPARANGTSVGGAAAVARGSRQAPAPRPDGVRNSKKRVVVVDAGHGGTDPGTGAEFGRGLQIVEKEITLQVARQLRRALQQRGVDVIMTRDRDTLIALSDRGRIANARHGDLFISIHINAPSPRWRNPESVRGFETYFLAEAKTEDAKRVEQMENEAIRFETEATALDDDELSFIIKDMAQNEHLRESSDLAEKIQQRLIATHPGPSRGVRQAGFRVLVTAYMPAVLVEIGFATNRADAEYMRSAAGQRAIAEAIAEAAVAYLHDYERRVSTVSSP